MMRECRNSQSHANDQSQKVKRKDGVADNVTVEGRKDERVGGGERVREVMRGRRRERSMEERLNVTEFRRERRIDP